MHEVLVIVCLLISVGTQDVIGEVCNTIGTTIFYCQDGFYCCGTKCCYKTTTEVWIGIGIGLLAMVVAVAVRCCVVRCREKRAQRQAELALQQTVTENGGSNDVRPVISTENSAQYMAHAPPYIELPALSVQQQRYPYPIQTQSFPPPDYDYATAPSTRLVVTG